jgi:hypothetical protein
LEELALIVDQIPSFMIQPNIVKNEGKQLCIN